jgi:hypothetical protein
VLEKTGEGYEGSLMNAYLWLFQSKDGQNILGVGSTEVQTPAPGTWNGKADVFINTPKGVFDGTTVDCTITIPASSRKAAAKSWTQGGPCVSASGMHHYLCMSAINEESCGKLMQFGCYWTLPMKAYFGGSGYCRNKPGVTPPGVNCMKYTAPISDLCEKNGCEWVDTSWER